jgi:hypothetical protein
MLPDWLPESLRAAPRRRHGSAGRILRRSFPLAHTALSEHKRLVVLTMHPLDSLTAVSMRSRRNRRRRVIVAAIVAVLAVGAFALWGPVGLGNGPVSVTTTGATGWDDVTGEPVLTPLPIYYSGRHEAVIDGVQLIGGTRYPAPHVLRLEVLATSGFCAGPEPVRATRRGFVAAGCPSTVQGPLTGRSFGAGHVLSVDVTAAAEIKAPPAGKCWVATKIVVQYHIGIRHFTASGQLDEAVCTTRDPKFTEAAMDAAVSAS